MPVRISFRLGNTSASSAIDHGPSTQGVNKFVDALGNAVNQVAGKNTEVDIGSMQRRMDKIIAKQMNDAVTFAYKNLMGLHSSTDMDHLTGSLKPTEIYFETIGNAAGAIPRPRTEIKYIQNNRNELKGVDKIQWKALSRDTIKQKFKRGLSREDARRHYVDTGKLRAELTKLASSVVSKVGTVKIGYIKNNAQRFSPSRAKSTKIAIGKLRLTFLPGAKSLPGLQSGKVTDFNSNMAFEKSLGLSDNAIKKLRGPEVAGVLYHRPLLQPVFAYWALHKVPGAVQGAILKSIKGT